VDIVNQEKFVYGASSRPDGYYAVVKSKSNDEKVFEQKCDNLAHAEQRALREYHRLSDK
jgi:hypothetical protein